MNNRYLKLRLIMGLLIVIPSAVWFCKTWYLYKNVPKNFEWNSAQQYMQSQSNEDDLILFDPSWVSGYAMDNSRFRSYSVINEKELLAGTFPSASRLWVMSMLKNPAIKNKLLKRNYKLDVQHDFGSVKLFRFIMPNRNILYDFNQNIEKAKVSINYGDGDIRYADWQNNAWVFPNTDSWNSVEVVTTNFRRQQRQCIFLHPITHAYKKIEFTQVPLGRQLEFFGGIADSGRIATKRPPVILKIMINEEPLALVTLEDTDTTFLHVIDTTKYMDENKNVFFEVSTADNHGRHFCFAAVTKANEPV